MSRSDEQKTEKQVFENFFTISQDMLGIADMQGIFIKLNNSWKNILGNTDVLEGKNFLEFVHPDDINITVAAFKVLKEKHELNFMSRYQSKNNCFKDIEWHMQIYKKVIYITAREISKQKKLELEMENANKFLNSIIDAIPDVIFFKDRDSKYLGCNKSFAEKVANASKNSVIGKGDFDYVDDLVATRNILQDKEVMDSQQSRFNYITLKTPQGIGYFETIKSPLYNENGEVIGVLGISRDISARKSIEEKLRVSEEKKSQFLANMSHEIRTPLNGIVGFIELLSDMQLESEQATYVGEVKASSDALLLLINNILDFSKIEAGMLLIDKIPFNLHNLVEEAVSLFSPKAYKKGIEIGSYIATGVPRGVQGDPSRLRQVLNNIIGNAVKFTDEGEVVVKVTALKECAEKVLLQIEVQDTGIGMSEETKKKLFQIFMQADASTTRKYEGTGLGLSISKKILELLGGDIEVVSELNKGSRFIMTLELEKGIPEDEHQRMSSYTYNNLDKLTVMIVDDNQSNRMIFQEYLRMSGCKVINAQDGQDGLAILRDLPPESLPQIVLVDYMMPGMSGYEFGRQVFEDEQFRDIRLILITSTAQKGEARSAKDAGFSGYISKPVRKMELIKMISDVAALETRDAVKNWVTRHSIKERLQLKNVRILLVEDMIANQRLEKTMLKKLGYSVELAINGQQALEKCDSEKFDLIFMDCQMPVMDGYTATKEIKKGSIFNRKTPVIAMTAYAMEGDREKCLAAGMDDYISKPITILGLEGIIRKYLTLESF
ncbi:response regulator [Desulfosporosinus sp. HMP52]|uniref:PAS domain-containing hybrid sensor histidine kinase/response regulator n=1 Tax=Desulfosporosinus sp. HMP52 TaxID=1487923 RepID=UPI00069038A6|nr:response regulator [Desulfosporosinus sp. HMP52]